MHACTCRNSTLTMHERYLPFLDDKKPLSRTTAGAKPIFLSAHIALKWLKKCVTGACGRFPTQSAVHIHRCFAAHTPTLAPRPFFPFGCTAFQHLTSFYKAYAMTLHASPRNCVSTTPRPTGEASAIILVLQPTL